LAEAVAARNDIETRKGFLGFGKKLIYTPTGSRLKRCHEEYSADNGARLESLLNMTAAERKAEADKGERIAASPNGNVCLDYYRTDDGRFVVAQLCRFNHFSYEPAAEAQTFKDDDAEALLRLI